MNHPHSYVHFAGADAKFTGDTASCSGMARPTHTLTYNIIFFVSVSEDNVLLARCFGGAQRKQNTIFFLLCVRFTLVRFHFKIKELEMHYSLVALVYFTGVSLFRFLLYFRL